MSDAFERDRALEQLRTRDRPWDIAVIGGGATGVAVALDAASRGFATVLVEQADFGKGTSSRSTKLVHGGVRYLRQGDLALVRDALRERRRLAENAPHLVHDLEFLIPCRSRLQQFYYGAGLKLYDRLAGGDAFGRSHRVSPAATHALVPAVRDERIRRGGVVYHDGQFDDTRLLIAMARSAAEQGACLVNYAEAAGLIRDAGGHVSGVRVTDRESEEAIEVECRAVVNAGGPFCDAVRRLDRPDAAPMLAASQGVHLVLPRWFFPGRAAMIVPKTSDGRVLFLIPWHDRALVGTTDTPIDRVSLEPSAQAEEIEFLLRTAADYLAEPPKRSDVLSVFTGIRPLVQRADSADTSALSRDHVIDVAESGLVTITGGKWTTARQMGEECVDRVIEVAELAARRCVTQNLRLHGWQRMPPEGDPDSEPENDSAADPIGYGSDREAVDRLAAEHPELDRRLHPSLPIRGADVLWAVRDEMARTVEDVMSRRTRCLLLDARAAVEIAPEVARLMADELGRDQQWVAHSLEDFRRVAEHYLPPAEP